MVDEFVKFREPEIFEEEEGDERGEEEGEMSCE